MSKHTPEPWQSDRPYIMTYDTHETMGEFRSYGDSHDDMANCARAVACVNACAGINPEAVPDVVAALREVYEGYLSEPGSQFDWSHWGEFAGAALAKLEDVS